MLAGCGGAAMTCWPSGVRVASLSLIFSCVGDVPAEVGSSDIGLISLVNPDDGASTAGCTHLTTALRVLGRSMHYERTPRSSGVWRRLAPLVLRREPILLYLCLNCCSSICREPKKSISTNTKYPRLPAIQPNRVQVSTMPRKMIAILRRPRRVHGLDRFARAPVGYDLWL